MQDQTKLVSENATQRTDEVAIHELMERWASAVRAKDFEGILANHSSDMLMFDVPPPFQSRGLDEYIQTWNTFFESAREPVKFEFSEMKVTAGTDLAVVAASMRCAGGETTGEKVELAFRLTVGLRKVSNEWIIFHEHHSVPATD